jgi:TolB-like protein
LPNQPGLDGDHSAGARQRAVFLSYASEDSGPAERICESLRAAGVEVWFDQSELRGGDAWDAAIRQQIKACTLFVPVISGNSRARAEGYFRLEWKLAVDRSHLMAADRAYLVPVVIDGTAEDDARVPDKFREVQWTRLPRGETNAAFVERIRHVLSAEEPGSPTGGQPSAAAASGVDPAFKQLSTRPEERRSRRAVLLLMLAVVIVAVGYFAVDHLVLSHRALVGAKSVGAADPSRPEPIPEKSVAVLPLVNLSSDGKDSYLGDGISGEILSALSKLPDLKVIGRASSFQFRDHDVDAVKVGRLLNVRSLLTGTVQRAGDQLRISVELIDTSNGVQSWSEHYDRAFGNLFALEDDIASAVRTALAVKLGAAGSPTLVHVSTDNPQAHDAYLRAKELSYHGDEASLNQAIRFFNQAIAEDPNYAEAWAGLAYTYVFLADAYRAPVELLPVMKGAAEKAVALDPELAEAHAYLGFILLGYERDFAAAERELEKAVALNPRSADVQLFRGIDQAMRRQAAAAQSALQMAEKIDPLNPFVPFMEMGAAVALGDSATTLKKARETLEMQPGFSYYTDPLVYAYASLGRWQDCVARSEAKQPGVEDNLDYKVAVCYAHVGAIARARRILAHIETVARTRYVDHSNIAEIYAALGENDGAIKALTQAYADRSQPLMVAWLVPEFKPLHDDKRFRALMERIYGGLKRTDAPT